VKILGQNAFWWMLSKVVLSTEIAVFSDVK